MELTHNTSTLIQQRAGEMPPEISHILLTKVRPFVETVQQDYGFEAENKPLLENEIALTLLAFEPIDELALNIREHTNINRVAAGRIAKRVIDELLGLHFNILAGINDTQSGIEQDAATTPNNPPQQQPAQQSENTAVNTTPSPTPITESPSTPPTDLEKKTEVSEPQTAAPPQEASQPTPKESKTVVQPLRTMEADMDRIHGYGAYRKMFPEEESKGGQDEKVVRAVSQDEVLKKE